ncbi:MAG: CPBP family intramembrane metalloprotease [Oscillospiraceae bacterium]|nr:CPBP family intramembrane metalloprotease [Oscillospiraceae bacterium]
MKKRLIGVLLALSAVVLVFLVEQVLQPGYWIKSLLKAAAFLGAILAYAAVSRQGFLETIRLRSLRGARALLLWMLAFFAGAALLFLCFRDQLDLVGIRESLVRKEGLTRQNCLLVFTYIIVCNSFLEEAFFRGFVFQLFRNKKAGALFSAVLFSAYHIGIFITWFNPFLFILCLIGLAAVGSFLQWVSEQYKSIAASWLIHACANIAINTVGTLLIFEVL